MQVYSVEGRLVRDPVTRRVVDQAGLEVDPTDPYWARLLADGDVTDVAPEPSADLDPPPPATAPADRGDNSSSKVSKA